MDLDSLISEILRTASSVGARKLQELQDEKDYRRKSLATQGMQETGALQAMRETGALQRALMQDGPGGAQDRQIAGQLEGERIRSRGELARQGLMIEGERLRSGANRYGSELQAAAQTHRANQELEGIKYRADADVRQAEIGKEGKRPTPSELYIQSAGQFFDPAVYDSLRRREIGPPPIPEDDITAGTPPPTTPPPAPSPARTTLGGGKSMVFGDEGSATPMAVERPPRVRSIEEFTPWAKKKKKPFEF